MHLPRRESISVGNGRWNACNTLDIRVLNWYLKNVSKKWALAGKMAKFVICNMLIFIYLYISTLTQLLPLSYVSPMSSVWHRGERGRVGEGVAPEGRGTGQ